MSKPFIDNYRLERIEQKLDKLSEAVIAIARAEERLVSLEKSNSAILSQLVKHEERISEAELNAEKHKEMVSNLIKLFWAVITAGATTTIGLWIAR